ncbi:MAG: cytochrome c, partial [Acidobacteriota bacterium]|nr:cytochrome c [Acidobacteriota bacterium]
MKRLVLVVIGVAALGSVSAAAQSPAPAAAGAPTFAKDVASIMYKKCANCHRPGEVAPMNLMSYEDARPWARAIKAKVVSREMPPWGADMTQSLPMRNDISLSQKEIDTIAAWVDGGAA